METLGSFFLEMFHLSAIFLGILVVLASVAMVMDARR